MRKQFPNYAAGKRMLYDNGFYIKDGMVYDGGNAVNRGSCLPLGVLSEAGMLEVVDV